MSLTIAHKLPKRSSTGIGRPRRPGRRLTSLRSARALRLGSEAPRAPPDAAAAPGPGAPHDRWGAPAEKPARSSPVRPAAPAPGSGDRPARVPAAAGAAPSGRRALRPSTGDLRLGGPTPASLFAQPRRPPPPATFTCADLALPSSAPTAECGCRRTSPREARPPVQGDHCLTVLHKRANPAHLPLCLPRVI